MKQFDNVRAHKPEGIENRKVHIIGGGIAGLASAVFLIDDCYVPGSNIIIYDEMPVMGGSMDGVKLGEGRYQCRGERELEPYMECLWYLCGKIPSLYTPGRTITEETVDVNKLDSIDAKARVVCEQGKVWQGIHNFKMSEKLSKKLAEMIALPEDRLDGMTVREYFGDTFEEFQKTPIWVCFHTMLAFKEYHSMIEMKRYMIRFIQFQPRMERLDGMLHTKYNEFDSIIDPILHWLRERGVQFLNGVSVTDLEMDEKCTVVKRIVCTMKENGIPGAVDVRENDMVIATLGSMSQNSTFGDNTHRAQINRDTQKRFFSVWEKLAERDPKFGHPEKFTSDLDKTKWMSAFVTVKGCKDFCEELRRKYGYPKDGSTGAISVMDSGWDMTVMLYGRYFADQAEDEDFLWIYGLYGERKGNFIKKPMADCTGEEILQEFLYHFGMLKWYKKLQPCTYLSLSMMPYITSQFMPRSSGDRPHVIPEGSKNYALIGQYVELEGDVVFTVETSIRTAMMAAYGLTGIDRKVLPMYQGQYDIRWLIMCAKKMMGVKTIAFEDLPAVNPLAMKRETRGLLEFVNAVPEIRWDDDELY